MKHLATTALRYGGQDYQPGDEVEVTGRDARTLTAIGKIIPSTEPDDVPSPAKKKGHGYQTRRLKAED